MFNKWRRELRETVDVLDRDLHRACQLLHAETRRAYQAAEERAILETRIAQLEDHVDRLECDHCFCQEANLTDMECCLCGQLEANDG